MMNQKDHADNQHEGFKEQNQNISKLSGVQEFYQKKNVLLTGATGFLGKVLMEKLLRCSLGLGNIYILVRQKRGKDIHTRIEEVFDDPVFNRLKEEVPKFRHKIVAIQGDCDAPALGLTISDRKILQENVNVIFHSAATVKFDEHLRIALSTNVRATLRLLELSKEMKHLQCFMHISTAFSNPYLDIIDEKLYPSEVVYDELQKTVDDLTDEEVDVLSARLMGSKWPNTYTYTKALTENELIRRCGHVPMCIFRPAIVSSAAREPLKSWIGNMYGPTGVVVGCVTGMLRTMQCDASVTAEVVPVDYVVNCLLVASVNVHKLYSSSPQVSLPPIFNFVTSKHNRVTWDNFNAANLRKMDQYPSMNAMWYKMLIMNKNKYVHQICALLLHLLPAVVIDGVAVCLGKKPRMLKVYRKIHKFSSVLAYFSTRQFCFQNKRTQELWIDTSSLDRELFPFDMSTLDWNEYFEDYLLGIRRYILRESDDTLPQARHRWNRLFYLHQFVVIAVFLFLLYLIFSTFKSLM